MFRVLAVDLIIIIESDTTFILVVLAVLLSSSVRIIPFGHQLVYRSIGERKVNKTTLTSKVAPSISRRTVYQLLG